MGDGEYLLDGIEYEQFLSKKVALLQTSSKSVKRDVCPACDACHERSVGERGVGKAIPHVRGAGLTVYLGK